MQANVEASSVALDLRSQCKPYADVLRTKMGTCLGGSREDRLRREAASTWHGRMINEYTSARVFEGLRDHAADLGYLEFANACGKFANEERHHGVLCGAVTTVLGGDAYAQLGPFAVYPRHPDACSLLEALLRNVISVSCMSETIAVALIGAELEEMPPGPLADTLREIWADEIGHARVGWRFVYTHVPELDGDARLSLRAYVKTAIAHVRSHELAHIPATSIPPQGGFRYGLCCGRTARELMEQTITQAIAAPLAQLGLWSEAQAVAC